MQITLIRQLALLFGNFFSYVWRKNFCCGSASVSLPSPFAFSRFLCLHYNQHLHLHSRSSPQLQPSQSVLKQREAKPRQVQVPTCLVIDVDNVLNTLPMVSFLQDFLRHKKLVSFIIPKHHCIGMSFYLKMYVGVFCLRVYLHTMWWPGRPEMGIQSTGLELQMVTYELLSQCLESNLGLLQEQPGFLKLHSPLCCA